MSCGEAVHREKVLACLWVGGWSESSLSGKAKSIPLYSMLRETAKNIRLGRLPSFR